MAEGARSRAHNLVRNAICLIAHDLGLPAAREPKFPHNGRRADVLVQTVAGRPIAIDTSIVNSPIATAADAKVGEYAADCQKAGYLFTPVIANFWLEVNEATTKLLRQLSAYGRHNGGGQQSSTIVFTRFQLALAKAVGGVLTEVLTGVKGSLSSVVLAH